MPKPNYCHVTVSIPYYQCKQYLRKAVESILGQTHTNLTLIVVNDGDEDAPWDFLSDINDSRLIRFDLSSNHGRYFADVVVLNATADPYFLVQDADDWSEPDRISILLEILREDHSDAAISAEYQYYTINGNVVSKRKGDFFALNRPLTHRFEFRSSHHGLFKTQSLRNIGGYYGGFHIGYDRLLINLLQMTGSISYINEPLYNRIIRTDSLSQCAATGMSSPTRREARRLLEHIYAEALELYIQYLSGHIEAETLARLIRQICNSHINQKDQADLIEASKRLRAILSN